MHCTFPRYFFSHFAQKERGLSKSDVHAVALYRRVLRHARECSKEHVSPLDDNSKVSYQLHIDSPNEMLVSPVKRVQNDTFSRIGQAEMSTGNYHVFDFGEDENSVSVSTSSDPEILVEEWANDSRLLLADAYDVRRLLRITLKGFQVYHEMMNLVRDDIFVAESRFQNRLILRSLLIWFKHMDHSRLESERYRLVRFSMVRIRQGVSFSKWRRSFSLAQSIRRFQTSVASKRRAQTLQYWHSATVPFVGPRETSVGRCRVNLLRSFLTEWRKERTMSHLDFLHRSQQMEKFHVRLFFKKLDRFRQQENRKKIANSFHGTNLFQKLFSHWKKYYRVGKESRNRMLDSSNMVAGYIVQKLALLISSPIEINQSVFDKTSPFVSASICHVVLSNWRSHVINQSVSRARANFEAINKAIYAWKHYVLRRRNLVKNVEKVMSKNPKKIINNYFHLWIHRAENRKQFRENLSDFATKTIVSTELPVFREWRNIIKSEKRLGEKSSRVSRKIIGRKFWLLWVSSAREKHRQNVCDEMSALFQRKLASRCVLKLLKRNRKQASRKRALECVGEKFSTKLALNRWRIVLATRSAWQSAFIYVEDQCDRGRVRRSFREWIRLIQLGYFWSRKVEDQRESLKRKILAVLQINAKHENAKRQTESVSRSLQQKHAIRRWTRYCENRKIFVKYVSWRSLRGFFSRWVNARLVQARMEQLALVIDRGMVRIALYQFAVWNTDQGEKEKMIIEKLSRKKQTEIFFGWNLLGKFNRLTNLREIRNAENGQENSKQLIEKFFNWLKTRFRQLRGIRDLSIRQETRLKKKVLSYRTSSWRQAVCVSRLERVVCDNKLTKFFTEWERQTCLVKIHEIELEQILNNYEKKNTRIIFSNWYFGVSNRQYSQMHVLVGWHRAVSEINRKREMVQNLHLKYIRDLISGCLNHWVDRCRSRAELRDRVFSISSNYFANQMRSILLGFRRNVRLRKNFKSVRGSVIRRSVLRLIDKWVNGTVIVISIRESMNRIANRIGPKLGLVYAMNELRENSRIAKLLADKDEFLVKSDLNRGQRLKLSIIFAWKQTVGKSIAERECVSWMRMRVGMDRFKRFLELGRERVLLESVADEFLVAKETEKLTSMIGSVLDEWRELVVYENWLRKKGDILLEFKKNETVQRFFAEWKYQYEVKLYESELGENERELKNRVTFRTKTKVFNQLILLFLDSTEVAKIGIDFYKFLLERRVVSALKKHNEMEKKRKGLRKWIDSKHLRACFDSMFKEVYLTFKERIAHRRIRCVGVFRKMAQYTQYRKDRAMMKLFGKWKREKEEVPDNADMKAMSRVFGSWKSASNEEAVSRSGLSYKEIRSRSVTPSSVEVSRIEGVSETSYKKGRNRK